MELNLRFLTAWILLVSFSCQQIGPIQVPHHLAPQSKMARSIKTLVASYPESVATPETPSKKYPKDEPRLTKTSLLGAGAVLLLLSFIVNPIEIWNFFAVHEPTLKRVAIIYSLAILVVSPFVTHTLASRHISLGLFIFYWGFVYVALYISVLVFITIVLPILVLLHAKNFFKWLYPKMARIGSKLKIYLSRIFYSENFTAIDILKDLIESPGWKRWETNFISVECPFDSWRKDPNKVRKYAARKNWKGALYHIHEAITNAESEFKSMDVDDIMKNFNISCDLLIYLHILKAYFAARVDNPQETKNELQTALRIIIKNKRGAIDLSRDLTWALELLENDLQAAPAFDHSL